ncbi:MAG: RNA polymerase sigma factor [Candidatus Symbiothrix sp.]|jgi:RNA polymerase sigma factor (sigma-70 family)|nr:RNA polymerase sigma factor [Candidatus Symbiothrix sp.]
MKENKSVRHISEIPAVYEEYKRDLKGYIARRVNILEDVEDVLQDVFVKLAQTDVEKNPIERISSWLYTVAQNQIIDYYRKKKEDVYNFSAKDGEEDSFVDTLMNLLTEESDSPEMQYLQSMVWVELEAALDELPKEQRNVFELTELEGFSFKDIFESTGIPVNTLLSRKRYAVLFLRERLQYLHQDMLLD